MSKIIKYIIIVGLILTTAVVIFIPESFMLLKFNLHAEKYMFLMLILFMMFLVAKQNTLMLVSLVCAASLAFFLRSNIGNPLEKKAPIQENDVILTVINVNLSKVNKDYKSLVAALKESQADIISLQELTPDWFPILESGMASYYPFRSFDPHIDIQGQGLLSKYAFTRESQNSFRNNVSTNYHLEALGKSIKLTAVHLYPPLNKMAYNNINVFLDSLTVSLKPKNYPLFCIGEFSLVPWSKEIQELKLNLELKDSRTDFISSNNPNWDMFEHAPVDYIFFKKSQCLKYSPYYLNDIRIGIHGVYRIE